MLHCNPLIRGMTLTIYRVHLRIRAALEIGPLCRNCLAGMFPMLHHELQLSAVKRVDLSKSSGKHIERFSTIFSPFNFFINKTC